MIVGEDRSHVHPWAERRRSAYRGGGTGAAEERLGCGGTAVGRLGGIVAGVAHDGAEALLDGGRKDGTPEPGPNAAALGAEEGGGGTSDGRDGLGEDVGRAAARGAA